MDKIAFLTLAVGDPRYIEQQNRLIESIKLYHPEARIYKWTNEYPEGSRPHDESMYGFKVHAVQHAICNGYTKIIWVDTACILVDRVDDLFELAKQYGVVAAEDANKLVQYCHPDAWKWFKEPVNNDYHLVGGSLFVFDFDNYLCEVIFDKWAQSELAGQFGTKDTRLGHRHDESCMALALYSAGSKPVPYPECRYDDVPDRIMVKKHFK
jgi:hypothetical protein